MAGKTPDKTSAVAGDAAADVQWSFNAAVPEARDDCVHQLIAAKAATYPKKTALHSLEGDLTYGELEKLSDRLAYHLAGVGVAPGDVVPLCFEKSIWTVVAMLGVLKAGAAFALLDTSQPAKRLQEIVQQCRAKHVCSSVQNVGLGSSFGLHVVTVGRTALEAAADISSAVLSTPDPAGAMYVVFTSGSTGKPKGIVVSHSGFCTALYYQLPLLNIGLDSRLFDFASYSFDVAVHNAMATLAAGGCVCVPSDLSRKQDVNKAIREMDATVVNLTASMARLLDPETVSKLDTLLLLGEAVSHHDMERWWGKTRVVNTYGPAECTPITTINYNAKNSSEAEAIGRGVAAVTWIAEPQDHTKLTPLGVIGELLVEGPILAKGYLHDAEKTATAFIEDPPWLVASTAAHTGRHGRVYKTGDLVRYNSDGTLQFVGRKDTQVKIRGQRVELGEVEHHVQAAMTSAADVAKAPVVAEVITPQGSENAVLVAFIGVGEGADGTPEAARSAIARMTVGIEDKLAAALPVYMVPSAYVPLGEMPMTATGKTDRRRLREMGQAMTTEQLAALDPSRGDRRPPSTARERQLAALWASVLRIDISSIAADDSFLRVGGDSIGAMRLVGAAREQGLSMTVADVFQRPRLRDLAELINLAPSVYKDPAPFSLLDAQLHRSHGSIAIRDDLPDHLGDVFDVLPATEFQQNCLEGYQSRCYYFFIDFPQSTDIARLITTCQYVLRSVDTLRTVFLQEGGQFFQVVLSDPDLPITVHETLDDLESFCEKTYIQDITDLRPLGELITRFIIVKANNGKTRLSIRMSHAQYDGISLGSLIRCISTCYDTQDMLKLPRFAGYIRHQHLQQTESREYWRSLLKGSQPTSLKADSEGHGGFSEILTLKRSLPSPRRPSGITPASVFIAACAHTLSQVIRSRDVVFGLTVTGRSTIHPDLQEVIGPCLNLIPIRFSKAKSATFQETCKILQDQRIASLQYELTSFKNIVNNCTDWDSSMKDLSCNVQYDDIDVNPEAEVAGTSVHLDVHKAATLTDLKGIFIHGTPRGKQWEVSVSAPKQYYASETIAAVLQGVLTCLRS